MSQGRERHRVLSAARRGQIIQRILVEGWSEADAASRFGIPKRVVTAWVRDYRRHGMASLRGKSGWYADLTAALRRACRAAASALRRAAAPQRAQPRRAPRPPLAERRDP